MKFFKNTISVRRLLTLVSFTALFVYVIIRSYTLSFTHDESLSFYIIEGNKTFLLETANHHVLNTTLMAVCKYLFGNSEFALRLPNVLSFALYLVGFFYISNLSKNKWLFLLGFSLVLLNPFLLEFFSLARGYGLSLGFMLMSLFFLLRNDRNRLSYASFFKDFLLSLLFASLATYSNLSMINFLIAILILFTIKYWSFLKGNKNNSLRYNIGFICVFLIACVPILLGIKRLFLLNELNHLFFGTSNLWGTIRSLIIPSLYIAEYNSWILSFFKYVIILSLLIGIISIIVRKDYSGKLFLITVLNLILIIGIILEHFLFGALYPSGRTALIFIPIFGLFIYYLTSHFIEYYNIKEKYYIPVILCLITPLFLNFFASMNLTYTYSWRYDAHTKDAMKIIETRTQNSDHIASISNNWMFEPSINYYIVSRKMNLNLANRNGVNFNTDFIYIHADSTIKENFKVLQEYNDINYILLMKTETNYK